MNDVLTVLPYKYSDQELTLSVLMTPEYINFGGRAHGGFLLRLLDEAAYICAAKYCGGYAITGAVQQANFLSPTLIGDLVHIYASVDCTGRSSMDLSLSVVAEDVRKCSLRYVHSCFITMVAVDEAYKTIAVRAYVPETPPEEIRFSEAKIRRELRQEYEDRCRQLVS